MKDIFSSPAFQEFLQKKIESAIEKDEVCAKINEQILNVEKELFPTLDKEILQKILEIDRLNTELFNQMCLCFHRTFYADTALFTQIFNRQNSII